MSQHEHKRHCRCSLSSDFTSPGAARHYPPDLVLEPTHRAVHLHLDIPGRSAEGHVTTTLEARASGAQSATFDAVHFQVASVEDADGHVLSWTYDGKRLTTRWADLIPAGEQRRVTIRYRVVAPASGLYFSSPTPEEPGLPTFAVTDHETERARHWLPCLDLPAARARLDLHLRAAAPLTILANGALIDDQPHDDGTHTAHWRLDQPCPSYLTCFAIGDFVRVDDAPFQDLPVAYFATPPFTPDDLLRSFGRTPQMLAWMTQKLGTPFPYPKYFQFAVPGIGGAMENISLVSWDDLFVLDAHVAPEWSMLVDQINVHEMAHSYFGDLIVCRDFAHAWLKESWATYMEMCWFEDQHGEDERQYEFFDQISMYLNEADNRYMRPIVTRTFNSSWSMYDGHLYPGGSCRLHTLRCALGDEVFWGAVQDYVRDFAFKTAETDDLRRAFERRSGRSLVKFFDQWLYSPGYPNIKASFAYDPDQRSGALTLQQTQADPSRDIPLFDISLHIAWVSGGESFERTVQIDAASHTFSLPMAEAPSQVLIDPYGRTLHKLDFNPGTDRLITQLTAGPTVLSRVFAAHALAKEGATMCAVALSDALATEPFWGVRVEIARALSRLGTGLAFTALGRAVTSERDPRALAPLIQAVGRWRDPILAAALTQRLSHEDLPPRALAALYEALGSQRAAAPLQALLAAAHRAQPLGFSQAGAVRALAFTRQADVALPALLSLSQPGAASDRVRRAVADALGELSQHVPPPQRATIVERLCDLLRDPAIRVRRAAHLALRACADTDAISALTAFRAPLSHQEQVEVDRTIASIYAAQQPAPAAQERALEDLREANRRLEERLRVLEAKLLTDD